MCHMDPKLAWSPVSIDYVQSKEPDIPERILNLLAELSKPDGSCIEQDTSPFAGLVDFRVSPCMNPIDLELLICQRGFEKTAQFHDEDEDVQIVVFSNPDVPDSEARWWVALRDNEVHVHDC